MLSTYKYFINMPIEVLPLIYWKWKNIRCTFKYWMPFKLFFFFWQLLFLSEFCSDLCVLQRRCNIHILKRPQGQSELPLLRFEICDQVIVETRKGQKGEKAPAAQLAASFRGCGSSAFRLLSARTSQQELSCEGSNVLCGEKGILQTRLALIAN